MAEIQIVAGDDAKKLVEIENRARAGANWFFWIAGLSMVNSIILISGANVNFPVGLGVTQVIDVLALEIGAGAQAVGLMMNAFVAAAFVLVGVMARKNHPWAFITGLVLYAGDALLFFLAQDWLSIAFHAWAFIAILSGSKACNQIRASIPAMPSTTTPPVTVSDFQKHNSVVS